jgi:hypothetical protein
MPSVELQRRAAAAVSSNQPLARGCEADKHDAALAEVSVE